MNMAGVVQRPKEPTRATVLLSLLLLLLLPREARPAVIAAEIRGLERRGSAPIEIFREGEEEWDLLSFLASQSAKAPAM